MENARLNISAVKYGALSRLRNLGTAAVFAFAATGAAAETVTIAALGDSLTQGYGLPAAEGLVPQLQSWLDERGVDVTLINAGVSGDTTAGGLSRVAWTLTPEIDAMIVALGGNDFLRGIDPAVSRANLDGILQAAQTSNVDVLLVGLEVSTNYGVAYKDAFEGMYGDLAAEYDTLLYPGYFQAFADASIEDSRARYMQADGIHPNAEGVAMIVEEIGPSVIELAERARSDQ